MKKLVLCAWLLLLVGVAKAQDPSYSQIYGGSLYLNPAYAGADPGWDLAISHRAQWPAVSQGATFLNTSVGFDIRSFPLRNRNRKTIATSSNLFGEITPEDMKLLNYKGLGFGVLINDNLEGSGRLRNTDIGLVMSKPMYLSKKTFFSFATKLRAGNRRIDWDRLVFTGQLDPVFGVVRSQQALEGFPNVYYNTIYFDLGFGGLLKQEFGNRVSYVAGLAYHNVLRSNDELISSNFGSIHEHLNSSRFTFHNSVLIKIIENGFSVAPTFVWEHQRPLNTLTLGSYFFNSLNGQPGYSTQNVHYSVFYGALYRINSYPTDFDVLNNHDAIISFFGFKRTYVKNRIESKGRYRGLNTNVLTGFLTSLAVSFSYDYTVSRLGLASSNPTPTGGTFELHVSFGGNNQSSDCFRLSSKNSMNIIEPY